MRRALVINAGSSSLKVALATRDGVVARHTIERVDGPAALEDGFAACIEALGIVRNPPEVVGHRIVHGGSAFTHPVRVDDEVVAAIDGLTPLAPLHQPPGLAALHEARRRFPDAPHVACFDTAFHATMPEASTRFALPRPLHDAGVRRYGFHGLSYEYVSGELRRSHPTLAAGRVVIAHLGAGASLCAMCDGRSVATTMGMTPLDGLPMATRPGRLDAGVLVHLLRTGVAVAGGAVTPLTLGQLDDLLNHRSGLLGMSGLSGDVRDLRGSADPAAREALDFFAAAIAREIAGISTDIGGLDAIVFTAGIGEHDAELRADVVGRLAWLGAGLDAGANSRHARELHSADSDVAVLCIATDEAAVIAAHALEFSTYPEEP